MLEALLGELVLADVKEKNMTTESLESPCFMDVNGDVVEILQGNEQHQYLSQKLPGDLRTRAVIDLMHRIQLA